MSGPWALAETEAYVSNRHKTNSIRILGIFLVALIPRIISLGAFVTPDERRWMSRSVDLLRALGTGDLSLAYHEGNPAGIITKWLGMIGITIRYALHRLGLAPAHLDPNLAASHDLWSFMDVVQSQPKNILDVLPMTRLPVAIGTAVMIVLVYLLVRRLWGERIALIGTFLIALDPFLLAHSRILHQDALIAFFVTLAVLSLALALQQTQVCWLQLCLAGMWAGLAALTKPSGFFLTAWTAASAVVWGFGKGAVRSRPGRVITVLLVWSIAAGVTYFVLWPAMWTHPVDSFLNMLNRTEELASGGHDQFFLGHATNDPGVLFYPIVLLFRSSPLAWVGLVALAWFAIRSKLAPNRTATNTGGRLWPVLFIVSFMIFASLSAKKADRYLLPVFPMLDLLAAMGLVELLNRLRDWDKRHTATGRPARMRTLIVGLALIVVVQIGLVVRHAPYYLTYYNPLAGGSWTAPHALLIGWGEGLDQAGHYLNQKPDADTLAVASFYRNEFSPYFRGEVHKVADSNPDDFDLIAWHATDYVVNYVSQVQRDQPNEATVRYFRSLEAEHVVRLNGIEYAWIYRTPAFIPDELLPPCQIVRQPFGPSIELLGYEQTLVENAARPLVRVVLYWQDIATLDTDYEVDLRIVDAAGKIWGQQRTHPYFNQYRTSMWPRGLVLRDTYEIAFDADAPPGEYHVELYMIDEETGDLLTPPDGAFFTDPIRIGEH